MSTFDEHGQLDPSKGVIVTCFGKKGSGKSVMALLVFATYPWDRLVISANRDDPPFPVNHPDIIELTGTVEDLPDRWPEHRRDENKRMTIVYYVDPGSATAIEDADHMVGVAYRHGHCLVLAHEVGLLAPVNKVGPHMKRFLHANRHAKVTGVFAGPRPIGVDPLVLAQSDVVYIFELRNPADSKRVAEVVGWSPEEMRDAVDDLGRHEYLRYDANIAKPENEDEEDMRLVHCPPLPVDVVKKVSQ